MLKLTKTVLRIQYWRSLKKLLTGQNSLEGASILARTFLQCSPLYYIILHYIFFKGGLRGKFFKMWGISKTHFKSPHNSFIIVNVSLPIFYI